MRIDTIESILTIICSLITVGGTFYAFIKWIDSRRKQVAEFYSGKWINEGDVTAKKLPSHFIELNLTVDENDGEVIGLIANCRNLETDGEFNTVDVVGGVSVFYKAKCKVLKGSANGMPAYGEIVFKKVSKNEIELVTIREEDWLKGSGVLPKRLVLFRDRS